MSIIDEVIDINEKPLRILKDPNILKVINNELNKKIAGEIDNRKTIFLISCGRLVENRLEKGSFNLMVNADSSAGKDYVVRNVLGIWPDGIVEERKRISPTALTYIHNAKFEPDWTWNGKILYLEDISNPVLNSDVFKVMASGSEGKSTIVVKNQAYDYICKGQPAIIITIASPYLKHELLRRFPILQLDESVDQTKEIMRKQAKRSAKGKTVDYDPDIKEALKCLQRIKVKVTFAEKLAEIFPHDSVLLRTCFPRFLDYIACSVALHQYQREKDEDGYYLPTGQDYDIARSMLINTVSNTKFIPLTKNQKRIIEIIKNLPKDDYVKGYSVQELEPHITFILQRMLYKELDKLAENGFLHKDSRKNDKTDRNVMVYDYIGYDTVVIPTWNEINTNSTTSTNSTKTSNCTNCTDCPNCDTLKG